MLLWKGERMGAGALPSFHDSYLQVLEQLEILKHIHELQVQTAELAPLRQTSLMEAGNQSVRCWNETENPEGVWKVVSISQVVVDLGKGEREIDGDGTHFDIDEKRDTFSTERMEARLAQGGGSQVLKKHTQTRGNRMPERGTTTSEVESEGQKDILVNPLKMHLHHQKETMQDEEAQKSWKFDKVWIQDDGNKHKSNEDFRFHCVERKRGILGQIQGVNYAALTDKEKDEEARSGDEREEKNDINLNSDRETASQTEKSCSHSVRLEPRHEILKREMQQEVYKELASVLVGFIPFEKKERSDSLLSFVNQIGHFVRDQFDLVQREETHSGALKDALTREHRVNEVLRSEKAALQDELHVVLSTLQQGSMRCANCQSVYNKASSKNSDTPLALLKRHKAAVCVSPEVGEDVAVEVIRSLSMTHNHQSVADSSMDEGLLRPLGLLPASKNLKRPSLGNRVIKRLCSKSGLSSQHCPEVPLALKKKGTGESQLKRKRGPEVFDLMEGGRESVEKSKRLADVEKELLERGGVGPQAELGKLSRNPHGTIDFFPRKLKGRSASPWVSVSDKKSDKEEAEMVEAGKRGEVEVFQDEEEDVKEEKESEGNLSGKRSTSGTETDDEDEETESDFDSQDSCMAVRKNVFAAQLGVSGRDQALHNYEGDADEDEGQEEDEDERQEEDEDERQEEDEDERQQEDVDERQQEDEDEPRLAVGKYTEFDCGVTNKLGEETTGILRAYESGVIEIFCHCTMGICAKGMSMTPGAFEKHGGRAASKKWRESIWVKYTKQKMPVSRVKELDAYLHYAQREGRSFKEAQQGLLRAQRPTVPSL